MKRKLNCQVLWLVKRKYSSTEERGEKKGKERRIMERRRGEKGDGFRGETKYASWLGVDLSFFGILVRHIHVTSTIGYCRKCHYGKM